MKQYMPILIFAGMIIGLMSCEKDGNGETVYMGTAYVGKPIPLNTNYSYSEDTYSYQVSFLSNKSYSWGGLLGGAIDTTLTVPCEYNPTTGEFSDSLVMTKHGQTMGRTQYFPTSFCIDDLNKMYLFTFDTSKDTALIFPRTIAGKISGSAGTLEGSYTSSFGGRNWYAFEAGLAEFSLTGEVNYTYTASTFSGTYTARIITNSNIGDPELGIEIISTDTIYTVPFSGTWHYNQADSTISETMTSPTTLNFSYKPSWVSYNGKLYMVTSLTRFYQKANTGR